MVEGARLHGRPERNIVGRIALWTAMVYCCRPMNGDEFEGKAEESQKNETLRYRLRRSARRYGRFLEGEDEAAGFGRVVEVETQAAFVHEVVSDGLGAGWGEGFAIGQAIVHLGQAVALEEGAARVFGRAHTPVAKPPAQFPNVCFDLGNDFFAIAGHGCNPVVLSCSSLVTGHLSLLLWVGEVVLACHSSLVTDLLAVVEL